MKGWRPLSVLSTQAGNGSREQTCLLVLPSTLASLSAR